MKFIENLPINIKNQHQLLNLLAEGYKTLSKALMEYIDNSFDSADDFWDGKKYSRNILIEVIVERSKGKISIKDNCTGMDRQQIKGLANSINESEKKRREQKRAWVNGQFGLGAHAFRFFAQSITVASKTINNSQVAINIDRDEPNGRLVSIDDVEFSSTGTLVDLNDIDRKDLKNLNLEELQKDIQTYFEMLLRRNVQVTVVDKDSGKELICIPFNYDSVDGIPIIKVISMWNEGKTKVATEEGKGVLVNLKVCTQKINRPPFFSRKGRRINYIAHMDSFMRRTEHRKKVWENYYLTGYIEVNDNLSPVITRDDFEGGKGKTMKRSAIYSEIVKLEDDIYSAIETVNKDKSNESFKTLASLLSDLLSDLAKEDILRLRYESNGDKNKKDNNQLVEPDEKSDKVFEVFKPGDHGEHDVIEEHNKETIPAKPSTEGVEGRQVNKEKEGVQIAFSTLLADNRSAYGDGTITIFTNHKDFQERAGHTTEMELGQMRITPRLANYLAAVISSEYKEIFYQQRKLEPNRKNILDEQIDFIFRFEGKMKDYINQPLDAIGSIKHA